VFTLKVSITNSNKLERCTAYDIDDRHYFITIFDYMPKEWK